jgi:TPR repeat protein
MNFFVKIFIAFAGYMVEQGHGCKANNKNAFKLYQKSAAQGNAFGQNALGEWI